MACPPGATQDDMANVNVNLITVCVVGIDSSQSRPPWLVHLTSPVTIACHFPLHLAVVGDLSILSSQPTAGLGGKDGRRVPEQDGGIEGEVAEGEVHLRGEEAWYLACRRLQLRHGRSRGEVRRKCLDCNAREQGEGVKG